MQHIMVIGGGFAGLWSAIGAARAREDLGRDPAAARITLVSRDAYLTIRPRLYEAKLEGVRVPLDAVLGPIDVERIEGEVSGIGPNARSVTVNTADDRRTLSYDRLVLAAGSQLHRPHVPGLREHAFSVDTFAEAATLGEHLTALSGGATHTGRFTAVVVGAGFTGLEVATELVGRLRAFAARVGSMGEAGVVLVEQAEMVEPDLGPTPRQEIEAALRELGVRLRLGTTVVEIHADGVLLTDGEWIPATTTVWTAGLRASPLAEHLPVERDPWGRVPVDEVLRVRGVEGILAAGDVACAMADAEHAALMSCQHAIPMGKHAGHNAVADLLGEAPAPYAQPQYVTCLDLGPWGALFTQGWDRQVKLTGSWAKVIKEAINTRKIYPPLSGDRREILGAAALKPAPLA